MKKHMMTRREWLLSAAAMSGAILLPKPIFGAGGKLPSNTLNMACIGVGGMGWGDLNSFGSANVVAICDVDDHNLNRARQSFPKAQAFKDYRKLLDKMGRDIDAVSISW